MFTGTKSVLACASIFLALAAQTSAHAMPSIALGVKGTPQRSDVQRPSTASPCGTVAIASNLDTSTAIPAAADGTVTMNVQNFNAGADGSTSVSVQVDETGVGNKFVAGTVKTNGNPNPTKVETDKVVFSLPAGTKCSGGKAKNLCLVSVKTTAGFGACTVVSQQAAAQPPAAKATTTKAAAVKATTTKAAAAAKATTTKVAAAVKATTTQAAKATATTAAAKAKTGGKKHHHHHHKGKKAAVNKQAVKNRMIETVEMREYEEVVAREFEERSEQPPDAKEFSFRDVDEFELEARDDSSFLRFARDD